MLTGWPATTAKASDGGDWRSLVVVTVTVLSVPTAPLVSPRRISWSWSLPLAKLPENKPQVETRPASGLPHEPTSSLRVTSWIVPLCQPAVPVSAGRLTVIWLPASEDIPPVLETLNVTT